MNFKANLREDEIICFENEFVGVASCHCFSRRIEVSVARSSSESVNESISVEVTPDGQDRDLEPRARVDGARLYADASPKRNTLRSNSK